MALKELLLSLRGDLSQNQWARQLGIDQQRISDWETGRERIGKRGLLALLSRYPERRDEIIEEVQKQEPGTTEEEAGVA